MTTVKIGRNEPCPCGSGKKYKKCCADKDEAARRGASSAPAPLARAASLLASLTAPPREQLGDAPKNDLFDDIEGEDWWCELCERLESAEDVDAEISLVRRALAEAPPPDEDSLLDVISQIETALADAGRHAEAMDLIEALASRFPDTARELAAYFARSRFSLALGRGDIDQVAEARRFAPHLADVIDTANSLSSELAYFGKTEVLLALAVAACPFLKDNPDVLPWAAEAWSEYGIVAAVIEHLDRTADLSPDDPALWRDIAPLSDGIEPASIRAFVEHWIELLEPRGDLVVDRIRLAALGVPRADQPIPELNGMAARAALALRRIEGWPRGRAWLFVRAMGPLLDASLETRRKTARRLSLSDALLPAPGAFVRALRRRATTAFDEDNWLLAAILGGLPAWLRQLTSRALVTEQEADAWLRRLHSLVPDESERVSLAPTG